MVMATGPSTPGRTLVDMAASAPAAPKLSSVRVTQTRFAPTFIAALAVPVALPAPPGSLEPFSVALSAFRPYARCAFLAAVTHVLYAFRFAAVLRGFGNLMLQARCARVRLAAVDVGLPASVASLMAALAAAVHFVR